MALALAKLKDNLTDDEPVVEPGDVEQKDPEAAAAAPEAADPMDELSAAVKEQAPPSIDEVPASPGASPDSEAPKQDADAKAGEAPKPEEAPLDAQFHDLAEQLAKEKGVTVEEAHALLAKDARVKFAQKNGMTEQQAREADHDAQQREAIQKAMSQGAGGGQGSAFGTVLSAVGKAATFMTAEKRAARKGRKQVANKELMRLQWEERFDRGVEGFCKAGDDLKSTVDFYNKAFLSTEAGSRLKRMAEDNGQSVGDYLRDLNEGKVSSPEAKALAEKAASDPRVASTWDSLQKAQDKAEQALAQADRSQQKLLRNFPDMVDRDGMNHKLESAKDDFLKGMKEPVFEPKGGTSGKADKEQKAFMERIREMTERIQRMIERLLQRLGLGGPKA